MSEELKPHVETQLPVTEQSLETTEDQSNLTDEDIDRIIATIQEAPVSKVDQKPKAEAAEKEVKEIENKAEMMRYQELRENWINAMRESKPLAEKLYLLRRAIEAKQREYYLYRPDEPTRKILNQLMDQESKDFALIRRTKLELNGFLAANPEIDRQQKEHLRKTEDQLKELESMRRLVYSGRLMFDRIEDECIERHPELEFGNKEQLKQIEDQMQKLAQDPEWHSNQLEKYLKSPFNRRSSSGGIGFNWYQGKAGEEPLNVAYKDDLRRLEYADGIFLRHDTPPSESRPGHKLSDSFNFK